MNSKKLIFNILISGCVSLIVFSCKTSTNGYEKTESGLEYKYDIKKDTSRQVKLDDFLVMDVKYYSAHDSLLFTTESFSGKFRMKYKDASKKGDINEALGMMKVGDSMSFKVDAKIFFTETRHDSCQKNLIGTKIRFEIALREIQTEAIVKQLKQELSIREKDKETSLLDEFISHNYPDCKPTKSGLYIIQTKQGKGANPKNGSKVTVHYIAHFINGEIFTNSYRKNRPFIFTLGKQEVIEGLEEGLLTMKQGGKAVFVIPSKLAYGEAGRKPVPPNSTIVFEMELLSIK